MGEGSNKAREISLGDDFGEVIVRVNGANVQVHADGRVETYPNIAIKEPPANDPTARAKTAPEIGDEMEDGTIYAGISPDTHKPIYATPRDAPGTYTFNQAAKYATNLDAHGHHDWRPPTLGELNVMFNNRAAIGGFHVSPFTDLEQRRSPSMFPYPADTYYLSSTPHPSYCDFIPEIEYPPPLDLDPEFAWQKEFVHGYEDWVATHDRASLRCVRS